MRLSILTWNIWDTPYFGSRDNSERVKRLGEVLYVADPDIALIQEAFKVGNRRRLATRLRSYHVPENAHTERRLLGFIPFFDRTGGLVTFSKYPILSSEFYEFEIQGKTWDEKLCGKGYTKTFVNTPEGQILLVNIHLSNRLEDVKTRIAQLEQAFEDLRYLEVPIFLGGDFNTTRFNGGDEQTEEFDMIDEAGFTDSLLGAEEDFETFSPKNRYNSYTERGRIDYIFFRGGKKGRIKPERSELLGVAKPLSDHYGYFSVFELNGSH